MKAIFQSGEGRRPCKCRTVRCRSRDNDGHLKYLPWDLQNAGQFKPNMCLLPQKNLPELHQALVQSALVGLRIQTRIPSRKTPAQHPKFTPDFFWKPSAIACCSSRSAGNEIWKAEWKLVELTTNQTLCSISVYPIQYVVIMLQGEPQQTSKVHKQGH